MKWQINAVQSGITACDFLKGRVKGTGAAALQHHFMKGWVHCNGKAVNEHYLLQSGDELELRSPHLHKPHVVPENIPLEIVAREEDYLVLNKPAGMAVHKGLGNYSGTLKNALLYHFGSLQGFDINACLPHRLDKGTSGLLLVVLEATRFAQYQQLFATGNVERSYTAIVEGRLPAEKGAIRNFIGRVPGDPYQIAASDGAFGKEAITEYEQLAVTTQFTKVQARLLTGRTHQLRIHMAGLGCPIWGDERYGSRIAAPRLMLHAHLLRIGTRIYEAPAPFGLPE